MIEVSKNLWVGGESDYTTVAQMNQPEWFILTCAKEPWHREALGYTSHGAPKDHPEYLFARRGNRLILNMVDADDPRYFPDPMIDAGLAFISESLESGGKILVHCNQGQSRGPGMALLWMLKFGDFFTVTPEYPLSQAVKCFQRIYPQFEPKSGILGVIAKRMFSDAKIGGQHFSDAIVDDPLIRERPEKSAKQTGEDWFLKIP